MTEGAGEKQWNRWVGFASYTYNTAEGGGVTGTFSEHVVTAGGAFLDPLNIEGEAALSFLYMNPIDEIFAGPVRNQYGLETYWRIQFTPHIWITPGLHLIFDPALNLEYDFIAIPQVKFRIAL